MKLKLNFSKNSKPILNPLNVEINGFINRVIGNNNKYHGKFSRYSVSSMQGGSMGKDGILDFPNGGYVFVSSDDDGFISKIIIGLSKNAKNLGVLDMKYEGMEIDDFIVNEKFDLVRTISPLILTDKERSLTFKDEGFIDALTDKCIKKLINCGYDKKLANTIKISEFHPEKYKTKMVEIKGAKNICNKVMFVVHGDKKMRKALYELGLGKCTGFGFGAVAINNKK